MTGEAIRVEEFPFDEHKIFPLLEKEEKCSDWPVVYLIHGNPKKVPCPIYIGETSNFVGRVQQHLTNPQKNPPKNKPFSIVKVVFNDRYNKSAILDVEQTLIRLFKCDSHFDVKNKNLGQSAHHDYFQRFSYVEEMEALWTRLKLSHQSYLEITSSDKYKFSPYTALTVEQRDVCFKAIESILDALKNREHRVQLISGAAGTGKTIVATKILSLLLEANADSMNLAVDELNPDADESYCLRVQRKLLEFVHGRGQPLRIGYVVAMTSLRRTLQEVFKATLKEELKQARLTATQIVLGAADVAKAKEPFDLLIVDEAHRLPRYRNISWRGEYIECSERLGIDPETTSTLDWIVKQSRCQILFYDAAQTVRPADVPNENFQKRIAPFISPDFPPLTLTTQMRCEGGTSFVEYIKQIFEGTAKKKAFKNYEFRMYEHFTSMYEEIQSLGSDPEGRGYSRVVAGFAWPWKAKKDPTICDVVIEGKKYPWNTKQEGWITSPNAVREIGCVHTTQGFDLAYVGVVIGPDLRYDKEKKRIVVDRDSVFDKNMKNGIAKDEAGDEELRTFVLNSYKVMLTRGVRGCFVYVVDEDLRDYLKQFIPVVK